MNRLAKEYAIFRTCPQPMRILLLSNMIYALVLPVIEIFVAAYVMRNSHSPARIFTYQLAVYVATPVAFLLNGLLLGRLKAKHLYAGGMVLSGLAMVALMQLGATSLRGVAVTGLVMGLSTGLFWCNRMALALGATEDANRNYYYGMELFCATLASVAVPALIGWFLAGTAAFGWLGGVVNEAYKVVALAFLLLSVLAAVLVERGQFQPVEPRRFLYWSFSPLWRNLQLLAGLKGLAQGYILVAPAVLVMLFVGQEGMLGALQAVGGVIAALVMYAVGRVAGPGHRLAILNAGLTLFLLGAAANAALFNALGVYLFLGCLMPAKQLLDLSYNPIEFQTVDFMVRTEGRDGYAYLFSHEQALFAGRAAGCLFFLAVARWGSPMLAVRYALLAIGVVHWLSVFVARRLKRSMGLQTGELASQQVSELAS